MCHSSPTSGYSPQSVEKKGGQAARLPCGRPSCTHVYLCRHSTSVFCATLTAGTSDDVNISLSPSDLCDPKKWSTLQFPDRGGLAAFACYRPAVHPPHALPAALVSPIFSAFLRDAAAENLGVCDAEGAAVAKLVQEMPGYFPKESLRLAAFVAALEPYLGCKLTRSMPDAASSSAITDASIVSQDEGYLLALVEAKNELGSADPMFQGQRYYQLFWEKAERRGSPLYEHDARPALFLELVGPNLRVSALASLVGNRVLCEPLTPFLPLLALTGQPDSLRRLAATLRALRNAVAALADHRALAARRPQAPAPAPGASRRSLPFPLRDASRFVAPAPELLHPGTGKLVYRASEALPSGGSRPVCVKFVPRPYPEGVHRAWADGGLAPECFSCEEVPPRGGPAEAGGAGSWRMVVMELLGDGWERLDRVDPEQREGAREAAVRALKVSVGAGGPSAAARGEGGLRARPAVRAAACARLRLRCPQRRRPGSGRGGDAGRILLPDATRPFLPRPFPSSGGACAGKGPVRARRCAGRERLRAPGR